MLFSGKTNLMTSQVSFSCFLTTIQTITAKMNLSDEVDLEDFVSRPEKVSAADVAAICQEAGMQAVRKNR